jgi:hypothetical protein
MSSGLSCASKVAALLSSSMVSSVASVECSFQYATCAAAAVSACEQGAARSRSLRSNTAQPAQRGARHHVAVALRRLAAAVRLRRGAGGRQRGHERGCRRRGGSHQSRRALSRATALRRGAANPAGAGRRGREARARVGASLPRSSFQRQRQATTASMRAQHHLCAAVGRLPSAAAGTRPRLHAAAGSRGRRGLRRRAAPAHHDRWNGTLERAAQQQRAAAARAASRWHSGRGALQAKLQQASDGGEGELKLFFVRRGADRRRGKHKHSHACAHQQLRG